MNVELWNPIIGYEGFYEVSNLGRVRRNNQILKGQIDYGYKCIWLCANKKRKKYKVHRLVAQAFIPNPNNYPCVNHKDENKLNNCVENLEWCTHKYNTNYGSCIKRRNAKHFKPIIRVAKNGTQERYESVLEASKSLNIDRSSISAVARGERKTAGGFKWIYAN